MYAVIHNDLVTGRTTQRQAHDLTILISENVENLRYDGEKLINVSEFHNYRFWIDELGVKHINRHDETWQEIECSYSDLLVNDGSDWRLKTEQDVYQEAYSSVEQKREEEYTRRVRKYLEEAEIKKHMGDQDEYTRLMDLAVQEREKIQTENPWPTPPTN